VKCKHKVLAFLESRRGQYVSGTYIAQQLNVSRGSVWEAVRELKQSGHVIEGTRNKGYCLHQDSNVLSSDVISHFLTGPGADYVGKVFVHKLLLSTNKSAKELAVFDAEHGTVVVADQQLAGKGRHGRQFFSPAGDGIYMSVILRPSRIKFDAPGLVTSFAAVAVCEAIEAISAKQTRIKWVNDIFIDGKKVCGILTEAVTDFESSAIDWIVVGIGINFNTSEFPEEIKDIAGAVFPTGETPVSRNRLIAEVLNRLMAIEDCDEKETLARYKSRLMMLGERVIVTQGSQTYQAVAMDIDDAAQLVVKKDSGEVVALSSGEVSAHPIVK